MTHFVMNNYSQIIDISVPLYKGMPVYPGNPEFERKELKSATGDSVISHMELGTHTGTHLDAPRHVITESVGIDEVDLSHFVGPCRVIDCVGDTVSVTRETLESAQIIEGDRILLKTNNSLRGFDHFYEDYTFLSPEAAAYLAEQKVVLVGIDYLSIKQRGSKDNRPHTNLLGKGIPILEGIDLSHVVAGSYFLVVLPLKIQNGDGAPARAILMR
jgi:arylformamidase